MSRNFHPCKLVPQIHVSHFQVLHFDRPVFSCLAFSVAPAAARRSAANAGSVTFTAKERS